MKISKDSLERIEKLLPTFIFCFIVALVAGEIYSFPFSHKMVGDEPYYMSEIYYMDKYGWYKSLSQGTSFCYTLLVYVLAKLCFIPYMLAGRLLSIVALFFSAFLFYNILQYFSGITQNSRYVTLTAFVIVCKIWTVRVLPDTTSVAFALWAMLSILSGNSYKHLFLAGVLLFISFAIKPISLFCVPGLALLVLLQQKSNTVKRISSSIVFVAGFTLTFIVYHVPGYLTYHKLMLEDKGHTYVGAVRVNEKTSWTEKNVYFEVYNIHHKPNKWAVSFQEVDSFKVANPHINLNLSYSQFVAKHTRVWLRNMSNKLFLALPYGTQALFFVAKWTTIARWVHNILLIQIIAFVLFSIICWLQRSFIRQNFVLFMPALVFYVSLSVYIIPQLELNWLIFCFPFFALPISQLLSKYVPVYLLLLLQLAYGLIVI